MVLLKNPCKFMDNLVASKTTIRNIRLQNHYTIFTKFTRPNFHVLSFTLELKENWPTHDLQMGNIFYSVCHSSASQITALRVWNHISQCSRVHLNGNSCLFRMLDHRCVHVIFSYSIWTMLICCNKKCGVFGYCFIT